MFQSILNKRNNEIKKEQILFALKVFMYVITFICSVVWIVVLHKFYVVPRTGSAGTDFGIAYGAFIIAVLFICYENIYNGRYNMCNNIAIIIRNYNALFAKKIAYDMAYGIEEINMDVELMTPEFINASDKLSKETFEDDFTVPDWEDDYDLLGIELLN